ncbi:branched-chain amino acid ABC transporter permease [Xanthobacter tagetidis]|uniref:Branched-chain amino acid ABC transporter permease n=1 Tax=Xanthobacter tagetidis TaxID=60216 RepID=A0A3L7AGW2_9HYPH|nr:branched-chain amino acid ABC transporter permease [Xanthobacter tagetidis]MBB6306467.1 branched-chain amino acid transport system permease protein [Xanthobacter tagetidis]RLP79716.1 branched-chain amino acid ABC transporter permease [Xanthobacter tagetidis]
MPTPFFVLEVALSGLLAGLLYSLVALGFVLIYKASGVFNFAQGALVLLAALVFVRATEIFDAMGPATVGFWAALLATMAVMVLVAAAIERFLLRPLVNQPPITLFMATIGLTFLIEGISQMIWGSRVYTLDLGIPDEPWIIHGLYIGKIDLFAAAVAIAMVIALAVFFQFTRIGRALRAVSDDHQAALSIGIPLNFIWVVVWSLAGMAALFAGLVWGAKLGVQFSISVVALKALPVLILGGFTSIPGVIVGGILIGVSEKLAEVFVGPVVGGAIESWFAYVLALAVLLVRPQGLFGEKIIERV